MPAKLVISFDFELGWGVLDSSLWKIRQHSGLYSRLRPVFSGLIDVLEQAQLPTTWAMVSSMLIDREADLAFDHLPVSYRRHATTFFREADRETRCAIDLLEHWTRIAAFSEVCSHTATHLYPTYPGVTAEQYVADVDWSLKVLEKAFSRSVVSLVFPRDQVDFRHEIARLRPMNFRLNPSFGHSRGKVGRLVAGASRFLRPLPHSVVTTGPGGEIYQSGSLYFNWSGGRYENIKKWLVDIGSNRLIRQMAATDALYHVWLHPFNLAETEDLYRLFLRFLKKVSDLRDAGILEVVTMADIGYICMNSSEVQHAG